MTKQELIDDPNSCWNKAADDEPLFVLRAKDPIAAQTVLAWAAIAQIKGKHGDKRAAARMIAEEMEAWRERGIKP